MSSETYGSASLSTDSSVTSNDSYSSSSAGSAEGALVMAAVALPLVVGGFALYGLAKVAVAAAAQCKSMHDKHRAEIERRTEALQAEIGKQLKGDLERIQARDFSGDGKIVTSLSPAIDSSIRIDEAVAGQWTIHRPLADCELDVRLERIANDVAQVADRILRDSLRKELKTLTEALKKCDDRSRCQIGQEIERLSSRVGYILERGVDPGIAEHVQESLREIEAMMDSSRYTISELEYLGKEREEILSGVATVQRKESREPASCAKQVEMILKRARQAVAKIRADMKRDLDRLAGEISDLTTIVELLTHEQGPVREKALSIRSRMEAIREIPAVKTRCATVTRLLVEAKTLYSVQLNLRVKHEERNYILDSMVDVLEEMGYEVAEVPAEAGKADLPTVESRTVVNPEGAIVSLKLDAKSRFSAEITDYNTDDPKMAKQRETAWCKDLDQAVAELDPLKVRITLNERKHEVKVEKKDKRKLKKRKKKNDKAMKVKKV